MFCVKINNMKERISSNVSHETKWDELAPTSERTFSEILEAADSTDINILSNLNNTNPEAKEEFLNNPNLEKPNNTYDKLKGDEYVRNLQVIDELEQEIPEANLNHKQSLLLQSELDFNRKKNNLALATYNYNHAETEDEKEFAKLEHEISNRELYGLPDEDTYLALLNQKIEQIDVERLSPEDRVMYDELMSMLGDRKIPDKKPYAPNPEIVSRYGAMVRVFYHNFLKHIPQDQDEFTPEDAASITNEIIREEIGPETDWHAKVNPNAGWASVGAKSKVIKFPGARSKGNYDRDSLAAILVHELGTHALRAMSYEDVDIKIFRSENFEGRETFEEGIAKTVEQGLAGTYYDPENPAPSRYIEIGLVHYRHFNFRQTFEIMKRLEHLIDGRNESQVFDSMQRVFRGTGELLNSKDLAYYNGNMQAWKYIEEHIDDPDLFDGLFLSGKINNLDPRQRQLAYEIKTGGI